MPRHVAPTFGARLVGIDGLRAVAVTGVVLTHVFYSSGQGGMYPNLGRLSQYFFPHMPLGVTLFFVLSGFLLYRPFASALIREQPRPSIRGYLRNRALRILPAYWVVLVICAVVFEPGGLRESTLSLDPHHIADPLLLLANVALLQNYAPSTMYTGLPAAWSLAIEVVFYLVLPLLVLMAAKVAARGSGRRHGRRSALLGPLVLLALGLGGKAAAIMVTVPAGANGWFGTWHSVIELSFLANADLFAFGMAVAVLRVELEDGTLTLPAWWRKAAVVAGISIAAVAALALENRISLQRTYLDLQATPAGGGRELTERLPGIFLSHYAYATLMGAACGILLALVVLPPARPARRPRLVSFLESPPVVAIGVVSYSLFLWNEPIARWLTTHHVIVTLTGQGITLEGLGGFLANLALVATLAGILAALTYRYVELPALRRKSRDRRGPAAGVPEPMPASQAQAAP